jgi:Protein of unknown function (DUF3617)
MMKTRLFATMLILAVAGCGGEEKQGNMSAEEVADELAAMKINPGQWEATNEILSATAPGMPKEVTKQMLTKSVVRNCITPEQAANPDANFLAAQKNSNCTYQDWSMSGGKMSGTMTCTGEGMPGAMVMNMKGEYAPTSYQMDMTMKTSGMPGGMDMTVTSRTSGRRVGECPAEQGKQG